MRLGTGLAALALLAALCACNYARMSDDEAVNTYGRELPAQPPGTVPAGGGYEVLRNADPRALKNPLPATAESAAEGKRVYENFCIQCHGPNLDGNGTVGQSFAPLPTDLAAAVVRGQSDGELFVKISLGYRRHPPLADTVSDKDRWAVLSYLRSVPPRPPRARK